MAIKLTDDTIYSEIANAIRRKKNIGDTVKFKPSEMAEAILSIQSDGIVPEGNIDITTNGNC